MKLIIINGSSCSGKSSIIKNIMEQKDQLFYLSYDALKWSFSHYTSKRHYRAVEKVMLAVSEAIFPMKYDIITDSALYKVSREELIARARQEGYEIVEINLIADFKILLQRFNKRVASALADPHSRISNTSQKRFVELFEIFDQEKNPQALSFHTDTSSIVDISCSIMKFL